MTTSSAPTPPGGPGRGRAMRMARLTLGAIAIVALAASAPALARSSAHASLPAKQTAAKKKAKVAGVNSVYSGKSAQGLAVRLSKPFSFGRSFTYDAKLNCSDGTTFTDDPFLDDVKISRTGHFQSRFKSDKGATLTDVTGKIVGRKASGTMKISERYSSTPNAQGNYPLDPKGTTMCASGVIHWTARAKGASKPKKKK